MLSEPQRRTLSIGLGHIETELGWIETLLDWTQEGALATFDDDLPDSAHRELRDRIAEAREMIRGLAQTLGLTREVVRKRRWIIGHLGLLWVVAQECGSRHLRGYGDVAPDFAAIVDPAAHRLAELLLSMERIASDAGGEEAAAAAE